MFGANHWLKAAVVSNRSISKYTAPDEETPNLMQSNLTLIVLLAALTLVSSCRPKAPAPVSSQPSPQATIAKTAERSLDEVAMLEASIKGDTARVKSLLDRGVNPNAKDPEGRTPLS